ncbi:MAG TPA: hypothetical protein VN931_10255 [Fibrobacteria bacterium]|nr:hypothetical protein [Fibrobacteria bacterium]
MFPRTFASFIHPWTRLLARVALLMALGSTCSFATWSASGTVKNAIGSTLSGVTITVQDSSSKLTTTTDNNGNFTIGTATGIVASSVPSAFSVHQEGNELVVQYPAASGDLQLSLVDVSGSTLWKGQSPLLDGEARLPFSASSHHGAAILRVRCGDASFSQPLTLNGSAIVSSSASTISARALATNPTLLAHKGNSVYHDTSFAMNSMNQSGINIVMRDTTPVVVISTCTLPNSPAANGGGSFTNYSFGQGTYQTNGYYQTACGYHGYEPSGASSDKMNNIANPQYFVAIPGSNGFNTVGMCGACVQLNGQNGSHIIATVTDECPTDNGQNAPCNSSSHLDVGVPGFNTLGFSVGNPSGTSWKYVPCPVTGNVVFRVKPGNPNEFFIENTVLNIQGVSRSGTAASRMSYGAWHFATNLEVGNSLTITDYSGRTINYTVTNTAADQDVNTGLQFPACQ